MANVLNTILALGGLGETASAAVDSIKINSISHKVRDGRPVVMKTRTPASAQLAEAANLYFRLAEIPISFCADVKEWQRWEVGCFRMLNGDRFHAHTVGRNGVCADKLPGENLWDHVTRGTLTRPMIEAAAREFHRAHQIRSAHFRGPWSHGDATATNVIYDPTAGRARLIDFEIVHDRSLPAPTRHADDLLVFLLDLVGSVLSHQWLPYALCLINTYGEPEVTAEFRKRLVVPTGIARIWWNVRTSFANSAKVSRRLEKLRLALERVATLEVRRPLGHRRAGHKRHAST
jgi:hypothetical protein